MFKYQYSRATEGLVLIALLGFDFLKTALYLIICLKVKTSLFLAELRKQQADGQIETE